MRLKFTLARGDRSTDLVAVVDATVTVGEMAARIAAGDPQSLDRDQDGLTLAAVDGVVLSGDSTLADAGIRSGGTYAIVPRLAFSASGVEHTAAVVEIMAGPNAGQEFRLPVGASYVGRDPECNVRLDDPLVSRQHAKFVVGDMIEIVDLGSANGLATGGAPVSRAVLRAADVVTLGETALTARLTTRSSVTPLPAAHVDFNRSPRLAPRFWGAELEAPEPPTPPQRRRFPMIPLLAPLLFGALLYLITHTLTSLVFVALSPLMMVGNVAESRIFGKRDYKQEVARFRQDLNELGVEAERMQVRERELRLVESPSTTDLVDAARFLTPLLWTRRPEHEEFLELRLGLGRASSRTKIVAEKTRHVERALIAEAAAVAERYATIEDVPIVEKLTEVGAIGVAGHRNQAIPVARALITQIATLHSPAEVIIAACASTTTRADWDWLKWLPHTSSPHSPLPELHLVSAAGDATALIEGLEEMLETRCDDKQLSLPAVVVVVDDPPADRARLVALAESGRTAGITFIWLASEVEGLPAVCRTYVDASHAEGSSLAGFVRRGEATVPLAAESIDAAAVTEVARGLAPLQDAGVPVDDASDLPASVPLLSLTGADLAESVEATIDRWAQSGSILTGPFAVPAEQLRSGALRAVLGQGASEPFSVDLRLHGPHALVGGTTGSGKSELLQSWILALASTYSPERVTFLLVDYKGGSAFRECWQLPHTVGLVTDLTPHLVRRTLTSLNAELQYRERLLSAKRAKDLVELERAGDREAPPNLIIVVDEFAALVQEVPEFVDGVVNIGQRGRSLGLHLILATQQPAGVIKGNLRANTNLRVALRVADETDSVDVIDSPIAAAFDSDTPGRAVAKIGPSRLVSFQSAYVGGHTGSEPQPSQIALFELGFGRGIEWAASSPASHDAKPTPTADIVRLVRTLSRAADKARLPEPRRPWRGELAPVYDLSRLPRPRTDLELVYGVLDDPQEQDQPIAAFRPERDGNLVVYGTGGAGKSTLLRTLTIEAGLSARGGPCQVYGLDFGSRGLQLLEQLPHVGAIIDGDDHERVARLLRTLRTEIDQRAERYSAVRAGSLSDFRKLTDSPSEPRILALLDGIAAFRQAYEVGERSRVFEMLLGIAADGRQVGVHLLVSADRPASLPSALGSSVQHRVVLRLADENEYGLLGLPADVLGAASPPGRGLLEGRELQVAVLGGKSDVLAQAEAVTQLIPSMRERGVAQAPEIRSLPDQIPIDALPAAVGGRPTLGIESDTLEPIGFAPSGSFLLSGPPGSGRTMALLTLRSALLTWNREARLIYFGNSRSPLGTLPGWRDAATTTDATAELATRLAGDAKSLDGPEPLAIFVESLPDFINSNADLPLQEFLRQALQVGALVIAEGETTSLVGSYPLQQIAKSHRNGLALQPDQVDGTALFRTTFPRSSRSEFPVGRGFYVAQGRTQVVQLPLLG